jgi:hypothetical protein
MTSEQRLDRLERIAKLFVRAGVRYRRDLRELGDKLNIMVDMQIKNLERFKQNEAAFESRSAEYEARFTQNEAAFQSRSAEHEARFMQNEVAFESRSAEYETRFNRDEVRLAKVSEQTDQRFAELAESQTRTDRSLAKLIKIVTKGRNGKPQTDS